MPDTPNEPLPRIEMINGQPVLNDPAAAAAIRAIGKHNCRATLEANADRVAHFLTRIRELGRNNGDTVIVIVNVDEPSGGGADLAEMLMPGHNGTSTDSRGKSHSHADWQAGQESTASWNCSTSKLPLSSWA